jgi:hypothetical protein
MAALALIVLASGCNGNLTSPMDTLNPGALSANFSDGSEFLSSSATVADNSSAYTISATEIQGLPQDELYLQIPENPNGAPYTVQAADGVIVSYYDNTTGNTYEANNAQGNCTINVTQISPTFEGAFSATVKCTSIADSIRVLSNGAFNATYQ